MREALETLAGRLSLSEAVQPAPQSVYERIAKYAALTRKEGTPREYQDEPWRQLVQRILARLPLAGDPRPATHCYRLPGELREDLDFLEDTLRGVGAERLAVSAAGGHAVIPAALAQIQRSPVKPIGLH